MMSWRIRDPPSPISAPSLEPEDIRPPPTIPSLSPSPAPPLSPCPSSAPEGQCVPPMDSPKENTPNLPPIPVAHYSPTPSSPRPSSAPNIRLDLVGREQWSTNPLQIKSTFAIIGENDFRLLSSPACGMGWSLGLDLCQATILVKKKGNKSKKPSRSIVSDPSIVVVHASLQSGPAGFPPRSYSIHASFRREGCVLAALENGREDCVSPDHSTILLGRCDITLPLGELFIDLVITLSLSGSEPSSEIPRTISEPMSKAIRATLDGNFPVDVKFMLFTRKYGETSVCHRRPIYASSSILKGRSAFLESHINGSHAEDDPPPGICLYPYDEDSDLESDSEDEDPPCGVSDSTTIEPQPEALHRALSPIDTTGLDAVQPAPLEFRSGESHIAASIFDSPPLSTTSRKKSSAKSYRSLDSIDTLSHGKSDSIIVCEYEKAETHVYDESMGQFAEVTNHRVEGYLAATAEPQQKPTASLPRLALVDDVAFRTFRALMVYMYTQEVAFIPLKSSGGRSYNVGDACSPKSMYCLAVKANHEDLKKHAFDNLRSQLGPANIITEIFSKFTKDYLEIFDMELTVLLDHFTNFTVRDEWEKMIDMVASGRLPHGADILKKVTRVLRT